MIVNNPEFVSINNNNNNNNKIFNEQTQVTQYTFPRVEELRDIFHTQDINRVLNTVKNRIINDRALAGNNNNSRIQNTDLQNININIINEAKDILRRLGYNITDIEDQNGIITAWKIYY